MEVKKRRTEIEGEEERVMATKTGTLRLVHTYTHICFVFCFNFFDPGAIFFFFHLFLRSETMVAHPLRKHAAS